MKKEKEIKQKKGELISGKKGPWKVDLSKREKRYVQGKIDALEWVLEGEGNADPSPDPSFSYEKTQGR